jgi:hypothetical protein
MVTIERDTFHADEKPTEQSATFPVPPLSHGDPPPSEPAIRAGQARRAVLVELANVASALGRLETLSVEIARDASQAVWLPKKDVSSALELYAALSGVTEIVPTLSGLQGVVSPDGSPIRIALVVLDSGAIEMRCISGPDAGTSFEVFSLAELVHVPNRAPLDAGDAPKAPCAVMKSRAIAKG